MKPLLNCPLPFGTFSVPLLTKFEVTALTVFSKGWLLMAKEEVGVQAMSCGDHVASADVGNRDRPRRQRKPQSPTVMRRH